MRALGWMIGSGTAIALVVCLTATIVLYGGAPFNPGSLSTEHTQNRPISDMATHADFESRCDWCHTPFQGPDGSRCLNCHVDVQDQMTDAQGLHGHLRSPQECTACHPDHRGRSASLTQTSLVDLPHNQFGFTLTRHQRDYGGEQLTCRSCHTFPTQGSQNESAAVLAACIDCHQVQDARFVADHSAKMGQTCLACHDGSERLQGFNHAAVYPLELKHSGVACDKCHVHNRFRGTPRECVQCHPDPPIHRGQFGTNCVACHTAAGWRPARLIRHTFPLDHGNKGKESACKTCHPTNYAAYTCYSCHDHNQAKTIMEHAKVGIREVQDCAKCHRTGKKVE